MKKKLIIMITALALVFSIAVVGTIAYLIDKTQTVENTFTVGDVDITLKETGTSSENNIDKKSYKMIPGDTLSKDPKVTVLADSEACWLFIKVEKTNNPDTYLEYTIANGWIALDATNHPGVYYREVADTNANQEFEILTGNQVVVRPSVTKDMMNALEESGNYPKLTFTAYAIQKANVATAAAAWDEIN